MRSKSLLLISNFAGLIAFFWPFLPLGSSQPIFARTAFSFAIGMFAIAMIASETSERLLDSKTVAIIGVLAALISALRLLGAGAIGIEPMWFLLIIATRAFGIALGYPLALVSFGVSALISGGVGPWLSFQMFAAGWIALGVALIPRKLSGRMEVAALSIYGIATSFFFGLVMDLQLWPWLVGTDTQLSFDSRLGAIENLSRFLTFHLASAMAWDLPRALTTSLLIAISARPILNSLRRASLRLNLNGRGQELTEPLQQVR